MIEPVRKRLAALFTLVIIAFSALMLALSFGVLHYSLMSSVKRHLMGDIKEEFLAGYRNAGASLFKKVPDENFFQLLNKAGNIVASTSNAVAFYPELQV